MITRHAALLIALGLSTAGASASSVLTVSPPPSGATPSILVLAPLAPREASQTGGSMVAVGEPAVSDENVSSVTPDASTRQAEPLLIRGGLVSSGNPSAPVEVEPTAAPAAGSGASTVSPDNPTGSKAIAKLQARKAARDARAAAAANPNPLPSATPTAAPPTEKPK